MKHEKTPHRPATAAQLRLCVVAVLVLLGSSFLSASTTEEGQPMPAEGRAQGEDGENNRNTEASVPTDPKDGAQLTRPARSLRVWFDRAPVVAESELTLEGPQGALQVQGLHTMGEDDLMARVVGPMPNGTYEATYSVTFADGESQTGSWSFSVQRPGQAHR